MATKEDPELPSSLLANTGGANPPKEEQRGGGGGEGEGDEEEESVCPGCRQLLGSRKQKPQFKKATRMQKNQP